MDFSKIFLFPEPLLWVNVPGRLVFMDAFVPKCAKGYENQAPRFGVTVSFPKDLDASALWQQVESVARKTWGESAPAYLDHIWGALAQGVSARRSPIGVQDGDLQDKDFDRGCYVLTARRRENQGPVVVFGQDGAPVASDSDPRCPKQGDAVAVAISVWAMAEHDRINFTVEGVRLLYRGVRQIGPPAPAVQAGLQAFVTAPAAQLVSGVDRAPEGVAPAPQPAQAPASVPQAARPAPSGGPGAQAAPPQPAQAPAYGPPGGQAASPYPPTPSAAPGPVQVPPVQGFGPPPGASAPRAAAAGPPPSAMFREVDSPAAQAVGDARAVQDEERAWLESSGVLDV